MVEINRQFIKKELQSIFEECSEELISRLQNIGDAEKLYHDLSKDNDIRLSVTVKINDHGEVNMNYGLTEQDWYNKYQIFTSGNNDSTVPKEIDKNKFWETSKLIAPAPRKILLFRYKGLFKNSGHAEKIVKSLSEDQIVVIDDSIEVKEIEL